MAQLRLYFIIFCYIASCIAKDENKSSNLSHLFDDYWERKITEMPQFATSDEVDQYTTLPGQALSDTIGEQSIRKLRKEAEYKLGDHFDIKHFHDIILNSFGSMDIAEKEVEKWIQMSPEQPEDDKFSTPTKNNENGTAPTTRIINGTNAPIMKYPFMTHFCMSNGFLCITCGGSLINEYYVITAAHCFHKLEVQPDTKLMAYIGDWDRNTTYEVNSVQSKVIQIILHENFSWPTAFNDIALLQLESPAFFNHYPDYISPICLPLQTNPTITYEGYNATVIGWGTNGTIDPQILQEVNVTVISNDVCKEMINNRSTIIDSMMCCYDRFRDSCFGDSGGPLMLQNISTKKWHLIGIVSFTPTNECAEPNIPGVYTRVTSYLEWILNKVGPVKCG